ncbi:hypothetical protein S7711_07502 [Stachybotrys chartarum IBT 7711]|uniref:Uncharacterized protein n=1 Tax=Stachybotrys chartarum (strain CBS 109288 / IBT 7711) TaxID=1280523 RepID=A0A084B7E9_STACB|nr:hypothetical protein S7711_07502 [Stachybotrys chartarum IBT 7711]
MSSMPDTTGVRSPTQSWTDTIYPFNRGDIDAELKRLNYNHFNVFLPLTGRLVPPHILNELNESANPRVADVATGNGIWLLSLADILSPQAELYGFDLDPLKFPSSITPVANTTFQQQDVLLPFPTELQATFDLVHVRLLFFGLKINDWDIAIRNMAKLLKPGGWILWEEIGQMSVRAFPPSSAFEEWWRAHMMHGVKNGRDPIQLRIPYTLLNKFKSADLINCDDKIWFTWSSDSVPQSSVPPVLINSITPMLAAVVEDGGLGNVQTMEDVVRLEETIVREVQQGTRIGFDWHWAWGMRVE